MKRFQLLLIILFLVPALADAAQPINVLEGNHSEVQAIGASSFNQVVPQFGKFGRVVVEMAQVRPPADAFLSIVIRVTNLNGRELRNVTLDFLEIRGQNYYVRMFVDGRENHFEYSAVEDRVISWWGPDKRSEVFEKGITVCEGTGIWTCAVQAGLWGLVNPIAGAAAGIACGIGFAIACN